MGLFGAEGVPMPSTIGAGPLVSVLVGRLMVLPLIAISFWMLMRRSISFFPQDPVFMLVICVEACTLSAYNLVTMCVLQGHGAKELSAALFYQSILAIFTMTAWVTLIILF